MVIWYSNSNQFFKQDDGGGNHDLLCISCRQLPSVLNFLSKSKDCEGELWGAGGGGASGSMGFMLNLWCMDIFYIILLAPYISNEMRSPNVLPPPIPYYRYLIQEWCVN